MTTHKEFIINCVSGGREDQGLVSILDHGASVKLSFDPVIAPIEVGDLIALAVAGSIVGCMDVVLVGQSHNTGMLATVGRFHLFGRMPIPPPVPITESVGETMLVAAVQCLSPREKVRNGTTRCAYVGTHPFVTTCPFTDPVTKTCLIDSLK